MTTNLRESTKGTRANFSRTPYNEQIDRHQLVAMTIVTGLVYLPLARFLDMGISLFIGLLILVRLVTIRWTEYMPGRVLLLLLTLGGGINVYAAYHSITGQRGGTALLATMLALKLLEARQKRDLQLVAALNGFLAAVQFLFDQGIGLVIYLGLLLFVNLVILVDLASQPQHRPARTAVGIAARVTAFAIPLAFVFFILFPRLDAPLWRFGDQTTQGITGMSDSLELGAISELVVSGELAFRVRFDDEIPPLNKMYWRGPVLVHTNGIRWFAGPGVTPSKQQAGLVKADGLIGYETVLEPTDERWLFALDMPTRLPEGSLLSGDLQLMSRNKITRIKRFHTVSAYEYQTAEPDFEEAAAALQLPENTTPRMQALVESWQQGGSTDQAIIDQALAYFGREPFYYTLLPAKLGVNPIDSFLFETREGFCEHYASSFAVLMRMAGIPTRLVLGYLGGEPNTLSDHYIIRQSDAHAWTEVWLEGQGWVRVDPTAAVAPYRVDPGGMLRRLANGAPYRFRVGEGEGVERLLHYGHLFADALDSGWQKWVLGFSSSHQAWMMQSIGLGFLDQYGLVIALLVGSALVMQVGVWILRRKPGRRDPVAVCYQRFCLHFSKAGLHRHESEGPRDYGLRIVAKRPELRAPVEAFISLYIEIRYGHSGSTANRQRLQQLATQALQAGVRTRSRQRRK